MSDNTKICPLLNMQPAEECPDPACLGQLCAWYIQHRHPQEGGYCAIVGLASIADRLRNT